MAGMTTEYRENVIARIKRDEPFAMALVSEAVELFAQGHAEEARSIMRMLTNAVGFEVMAKAMGKNSKTLHRQLSPSGNPSMNATSEILKELTVQLFKKPMRISVQVQAT